MKRLRRKKWRIALSALCILLPGLFLGFLALGSLEEERQLQEEQFRQLIGAELRLFADEINRALDTLEERLQRGFSRLPPENTEAQKAFFARWQRQDPLVDIPFLLDHRMALILPEKGTGSPRLQAFRSWGEPFFQGLPENPELNRLLEIWKRGMLSAAPSGESRALRSSAAFSRAKDSASLPQAPPKAGAEKAPALALPPPESEERLLKEEPLEAGKGGDAPLFFRDPQGFPQTVKEKTRGILPFMTDNRLLYLFWTRRGSQVGGCLLNEDVLGQYLASSLETLSLSPGGLRTLLLRDERGRVLFPSGEKSSSPEIAAFLSREISPRLPYWRGEARLSPQGMTERARQSRNRQMLLIGALLFFFLGGSLLLFRALGMEMRTARQKTTFVAAVSHELKTPLTSLRLFTEMLRTNRVQSEEKRHRYLDLMTGEIHRLTRLIDNVLDFSREERGVESPRTFRKADLLELAREVAENQRPGLKEKGFSLRLIPEGSEDPREFSLSMDPGGVTQILLNLLTNGEKYSPPGKELEIVLENKGRELWLEVRDRGPGIPRKEREHIFEEFYRGSEQLTSSSGGAGLGLAISRRIARSHGGDLTALPRKGGGSVFRLVLPRNLPPSEKPDHKEGEKA